MEERKLKLERQRYIAVVTNMNLKKGPLINFNGRFLREGIKRVVL